MFATLIDPADREADLVGLSVLVFLPAAFAAGLLLIPGRLRELMRWWALFGACGTLAVALCAVVGSTPGPTSISPTPPGPSPGRTAASTCSPAGRGSSGST